MATYKFANQAGGNNLSNPGNWSSLVTPGPADIAIIDSVGVVPTGQTLSVSGSLNAAMVQLFDSIELQNVSIYTSHEFSVAGLTHFESGSITVNTGANPGNFDVGGTDGRGQFIQDSGSVSVNTGLLVGYRNDGSYALNGGTVSASFEIISGTSNGVFRQSGGSNSVAGALTLGQSGGPSVGNSGVYFLKAGNLSAGLETVGDASAGEISQSGGSNSVAGTLTLGNQQASSGVYYLTGGTLSVGGNEVLGFSGNGRVDHGGGSNTVHGGIILGVKEGSSANYILHDSGYLRANFLTVGIEGSGEVSIQHARADVAGPVSLGTQVDGHGTLEVMVGGRLNVQGQNGSNAIKVGVNGSGTLVVQGGGSITTDAVIVGIDQAGHGIVDVEGAGSALSVADNIVLGWSGHALMRVAAGAHVSTDRIVMAGQGGNLATQTGSLAAMEISGSGTLLQAQGAVAVGLYGAAALSISNGAVLQAGSVTLGVNAGSNGAMALNGGTVNTTTITVGGSGNAGVIADGGGNSISATSIVDNGRIEVANSSSLKLQGSITGAGPMVIDANGTLELNNAALGGTGDIVFRGNDNLATPTTLQIDTNAFLPSHLINGLNILNGTDTIVGFTSGDVIDLRFVRNGKARLLHGQHQNVLEVDGAGSRYFLQLDLLANYDGVKFATAGDGFGGTDIYLEGTMAKTGGTTFSNSHAAKRDQYSFTDSQADQIQTLDLLSQGDPASAALYSIGNSTTTTTLRGNISVPTDLLNQDSVGYSIKTTLGAAVTVVSGSSVTYDMRKIAGLIDDLGAGQQLSDSFLYAIRMGNGTVSWNTVNITLTGQAANVRVSDHGVQEDVNGGAGVNRTLTDTVTVDAFAASGNPTGFTIVGAGDALGPNGANLGVIALSTASGHVNLVYSVSDAAIYNTHLGFGEFTYDSFTLTTKNGTTFNFKEAVEGNIHAATFNSPISSLSVNAGASVGLNIAASDHDDNAHLTYTVSGVPSDAILSSAVDPSGVHFSGGVYTIDAGALRDMTLKAGQAGTTTLTVTVTNTEGSGTDIATATATESIALTVKPLAPPLTAPTSYTFTTINAPLGVLSTQVFGINDSGEMVGYYVDASLNTHGFILNNGVFTTIDDPHASLGRGYGTEPLGINDFGQIVGWYADSSGINHGFIYDAHGFTTLDDTSQTNITLLRGINSSGQIVGYGSSGGIEYSGGVFTTFNDPSANAGTTNAFGINDRGEIVGNYVDSRGHHGFRYKNGVFSTIDDPTPGASQSNATGINNEGQIVGGYALSGGGVHSYIDNAGVFTDINDPASNNYTQAVGINNRGQLVGFYIDSQGATHGFLANPQFTIGAGQTAEPSTEYATASVVFAASTGTLKLDASQNFRGQISGFGGQDVIDLADINFSTLQPLGYSANSTGTGGVLHLSDGLHSANIALLGQYAAASFTAASDGHGGTFITDPALAVQNHLAPSQV